MKRALSFLRLIDEHDGNISLTNVALMVALGKLAWVPELSGMDLGVLVAALVSYQGKKVINKGEGIEEQVTKIEENVTNLHALVTSNNGWVEETTKRMDEMASKVNAASMAIGLKDMRK